MTSRSDALMTTVLLFSYFLHFEDAGPEDIGLRRVFPRSGVITWQRRSEYGVHGQ